MNTTLRTCPDIGVWRAWLDHEQDDPEHAPLTEHLSDCPGCQRLVAELREDASDVRHILAILAPTRTPTAADIAVARERLAWRRGRITRASNDIHTPSPRLEPTPMFLSRISTPWRVAATGLAAALVLGLLVAFTPQGSSVAAAFLSQFRSQQVTAIEITPQTQSDVIRTLNALGNLGTVQMPGATGTTRPEAAVRAAEVQQRTVSLAEAAQTVGFPLATPDPAMLPAGMDKTPLVHVMPAQQIRFTFDKTKAHQYFQSSGHPEVTVPDKYDGATLVVSIPSAALLEYGNGGPGKNGLIVAEAGELVVDVQGNVSLPEMRDYLLGLPGLPPTVVSQLKQIQNWNNTLPIPVPIDQVHWQSTTINGAQGLLLNDNSGVGSAAIWHTNGHLMGVAGSLKATELKRLSDSLAVR